jgi:transcriptional regulator with XRE-family HTH domain
MKSEAARHDEARRLIDRLLKISPDIGLTSRALRLRARLKLPMSTVMDKVPGTSVIEKAKAVNVSRQTVYYWINGTTRPSRKQAKLLAAMTGYDAAEIAGRS